MNDTLRILNHDALKSKLLQELPLSYHFSKDKIENWTLQYPVAFSGFSPQTQIIKNLRDFPVKYGNRKLSSHITL